MARIGTLAVVFALVAPATAAAQFGGGGFGMGGGFARPAANSIAVEIEDSDGNRLRGPVALTHVAVECAFGTYRIRPDKIREIRFDAGEDRPTTQSNEGILVPGTVVATSGAEIAGLIAVPNGWTVETDLGVVTLAPGHLRSITFLPVAEGEDDGEGDAGPAARTGRRRRGRADAPQVMQIGSMFWAISPSGDRVAVRLEGADRAEVLELPASEEEPLRVTPVVGGNLAALQVEGGEVARVAAFSLRDGRWHPQDLREPVSGAAGPIVSQSLAAYGLGRFVYAFSAEANRWGVLELPEGSAATMPVVGAGSVVVHAGDRIHTFSAGVGEWTSTGADDLLGDPGDEGGGDPPTP